MTAVRTARVAAFLLVALAARPALAETSGQVRPDLGLAHAESIAAQMDADRDGLITAPEAEAVSGRVFASMDADASGDITRAEMRGWEFGMADLAAFRNRSQAYDTAIGIAFDVLDDDRDGRVTAAEHAAGIARSIAVSDADGDGGVSRTEFLQRFVYSVAMRNALQERP